MTVGVSYAWHWSAVFNAETMSALGRGIEYTLLVSALALAFGTLLGIGSAVVRVSRVPFLSQVSRVYTDFFRTTPALVQLIWIFYVVPILLGQSLTALTAGVVALSLNAGAFLSEIFRGGLESIHRGQRDAAFVLGLSPWQSLRHVVLPQALRRALPATGNVFISLLKDSSLLSVIAVSELTYQAQAQVARSFQPLELYTALAIVYFLMTYPLSLAMRALERRVRIT